MAELTSEPSPDGMFGTQAGHKSCKSDLNPESAGTSPLCPHCGSKQLHRDGVRYLADGWTVQRWLCRNCTLRFSDPADLQNARDALKQIETVDTKAVKSKDGKILTCQISATKKDAKNLEPEQTFKEVPEMNKDAKGMLVQYEAKMLLEGYGTETIRGSMGCLRALLARNVNLMEPESVKKALATEEAKRERSEKCWSQNRRRNVINAYTLFLKFQNRSWIKPKCTVDEKFAFIPTEAEIDVLIAGSFPKLAAFLQLMKETAMRSGEAHRLEWIDIDATKRIITLNKPEKHSRARMFKVSENLIEMLNNLPKKSTRIFPCSLKGMKVTYVKTRKRLANKLGNPRLKQITCHTFRHWKATMLYHETKDAHYVQQFLGHKSIKSTEVYINIEHVLFQTGGPDQKFTIKVSDNPQEIAELLADGFEAHCNQGNLIFLRKRK